jgi:hypothetical protein
MRQNNIIIEAPMTKTSGREVASACPVGQRAREYIALAKALSETDSQISKCDDAAVRLRLKSRYAQIDDLIESTLEAVSFEQARALGGARFQLWIAAEVFAELAELAKSVGRTPCHSDAADRAARRGLRLLHSALKVVDEAVKAGDIDTVDAMPLTGSPIMRGTIRARRERTSHRHAAGNGTLRLAATGGASGMAR